MKRNKTLISQNSTSTLFQRVEGYSSRPIDGKILAGILKMAYHCGLKRGEILDLTLNKIVTGTAMRIANKLRLGGGQIPLTPQIRNFLVGHLTYLRSKEYRLSLEIPLFPTPIKRSLRLRDGQGRGGTRYDSRKLSFHLKQATFDAHLN